MKRIWNIQSYSPFIILLLITIAYFYPFFFGFIPIPGDILLTTYFPWRDQFWIWDINQLPFTTSNFWTFDAVRAIYPWQYIGIEILKNGQIPLWNPYAFAGTPLIANNQSAIFYPLNILYFLTDFSSAWGILTILQPLLGSIFLFILLKEYKIGDWFCLWGAILFGWGGFMASYLHTHVLGHTLIWLPLSIFALHRINEQFRFRWIILFLLTLICSLLAGHLQVGFYSLFSIFLYQIIIFRQKLFSLKNLLISSLILSAILITSPQIVSTIELSANIYRDTSWYTNINIPPLHLTRLLVPHMFGHVATHNWSSDINFKEFPYIGILGLIFASIAAVKYRSNRIYLFWASICLLIIAISLDTPITKLINKFFGIFQNFTPLRAYGIVDLSLAILSAKGFEWIWKNQTSKKTFLEIILFFLITTLLFIFISFNIINIPHTSKSQLIFIFLTPFVLISTLLLIILKNLRVLKPNLVFLIIFVIGILDVLLGHALYSRSFTHKDSLYPNTDLIGFLQNNLEGSRFLSTDPWTLPPNTFLPYNIRTISVYDPSLYKYSYLFAEQWRKNLTPNTPPFTRAIEQTSFNRQLLNILNIKYVISPEKIDSPYL